jgi:hypothetical protein
VMRFAKRFALKLPSTVNVFKLKIAWLVTGWLGLAAD